MTTTDTKVPMMENFVLATPMSDYEEHHEQKKGRISGLNALPLRFNAKHNTHLLCAIKPNERRVLPLAIEIGLNQDDLKTHRIQQVKAVISTVTHNSSFDNGLLDHNMVLQNDNDRAPVAVKEINLSLSNPSPCVITALKGGRITPAEKKVNLKRAAFLKVGPRDAFEVEKGIRYDVMTPANPEKSDSTDMGPQHGFKLLIQLLVRGGNSLDWCRSTSVYLSPARIIEYSIQPQIEDFKFSAEKNVRGETVDVSVNMDIWFTSAWLRVDKALLGDDIFNEYGFCLELKFLVQSAHNGHVPRELAVLRSECVENSPGNEFGHLTAVEKASGIIKNDKFHKNSMRCRMEGLNWPRLIHNAESCQSPLTAVLTIYAFGPQTSRLTHPLSEPTVREFEKHPCFGLIPIGKARRDASFTPNPRKRPRTQEMVLFGNPDNTYQPGASNSKYFVYPSEAPSAVALDQYGDYVEDGSSMAGKVILDLGDISTGYETQVYSVFPETPIQSCPVVEVGPTLLAQEEEKNRREREAAGGNHPGEEEAASVKTAEGEEEEKKMEEAEGEIKEEKKTEMDETEKIT